MKKIFLLLSYFSFFFFTLLFTPKLRANGTNENFLSLGPKILEISTSIEESIKNFPFFKTPFRPYFAKDVEWFKKSRIGTAFAIGPETVMTAAHVVDIEGRYVLNKNKQFPFKIIDHRGIIYPVKKIKKLSFLKDFVIFELETKNKPPLDFFKIGKAKQGEKIAILGYPLENSLSLTTGTISSLEKKKLAEETWSQIFFSAPVAPGNSGGPLVNSKGEAIGIVLSMASQGTNIALDIQEAMSFPDYSVEVKDEFFESTLLEEELNLFYPGPSHQSKISFSKNASIEQVLDLIEEEILRVNKKAEKDVQNFLAPYRLLSSHSADFFLENSVFKIEELAEDKKIVTDSVGKVSYSVIECSIKEQDFKNISNKYFDYCVSVFSFSSFSLAKIFFGDGAKTDAQRELMLKNPEIIANGLAQSGELQLSILYQPLKITEVGAPYKSEWVRDSLGRPWRISSWYFFSGDVSFITICSPNPSGFWCFYKINQSNSFSQNHVEIANLFLALEEILFSYRGYFSEWVSYLKLESKYLSDLARSFSFSWNPSHSKVMYQFGPFNGTLQNSILENETLLVVSEGYKKKPVIKKNDVEGLFFLFGEKASVKSLFIKLDPIKPNLVELGQAGEKIKILPFGPKKDPFYKTIFCSDNQESEECSKILKGIN